MVWYDQHRLCQDGTLHEGKLELITWEGKSDDGMVLGFGATFLEESDDTRKTFETQFKGSEAHFFDYWPQGYRWTCCGCTGDMDYGCDHHGTGSKPCTCDFCHMGKALPDSLYMKNEQATRGLQLSRGPDPRSYNPIKAALCESARSLFGMDPGTSGGDAPFGDMLDKLKLITSFMSQSPGAAAAFAQAQARTGSSTGGASSSSSRGAGASTSTAAAGSSKKTSGSSSSSSSSKQQVGKGVKTCVCTVCGVEKPVGQMKCCSGCKAHQKVPHCSKECQNVDWPQHSKACKEVQRAAEVAAGAAGASSKAAAH